MLLLQDITYIHPNKDALFTGIDLIVNKHCKAALIGNNGAGKSTLLQLLAGNLSPSSGLVKASSRPWYVPQILGQFNNCTVARALQIDGKLTALHQILAGEVSSENMALLDDDWGIEERCTEAFAYWQLDGVDLQQAMGSLSGGQKTKVMLAGIRIHRPEIVLLDEPSNHLDMAGRALLYQYLQTTNHTLLVVSHDRTLLNLLDTVFELSKRGITTYGGNYDFYAAQKAIATEALNNDVRNREKELRKARDTERAAMERQQKLDARGKKKQEKAGVPTIMMNTLRNKAERSTAQMRGVHAEKVGDIAQKLSELRRELPGTDKMKMDLDNSALHRGKVLVNANSVNIGYGDNLLWRDGIDFKITSGARMAIKGPNGSGKTSLIRLVLGQLLPLAGKLDKATFTSVYIDQDYSLINQLLTVYGQAQQFNTGALQEHDIKIRLNRFLFTADDWDKSCNALSGGEKMRLMLCCLAIGNQAPDMMILDEPTNNLDMQNVEILTNAINQYRGTLLVVSHDEWFLKEIGVEEEIVVGG
ncbi:ABC-F family ATP-binding cassette domain-containing protein [Mucilaginibacter mali]|uniref:ABC-F family ATP-binding cassette domain-containing protein n=1 Tax=Mucilaginibacter mali TaxID=2740462 RepID=A0A7D4U9W3_9SPHI|nr:ABC-F family ATP-binding cassette domain-containing protein [Mucilaginibacter mali]QKJ29438.1 ABC-F family ATP-binding cassette domain-containing protein [Mucilaginibacter mali]